ncbi:actin-like protein, putative [Plasmodium gallinaceum]|uniref:Actin-like protein, putative n=1 Tax=Plasmodium gallinaceum TaxID=5849 RepID=A0A1J1GWL6_PLAGA|nr:actin-like protein, putative [Plasmodium gallinaceum]CRG96655.1 actin-like protein, putative [Plasmodium gallinaceum]
MDIEENEKKIKNYSPLTKNLYMKLNNPIGLYVNLDNSLQSSEKKKLNNRLSFSSFSNTTCSDILKLNNFLHIENNILILTLNNYSFKFGLINMFDYKLQSLRLPQIEIIEPWKEIGYIYPPYKNYDILEESIYYCFSNIYKINLKNKDIFIPFSSRNTINDFSTIGDILFDSFQVHSIAFKEPSFVSSLIILEELKKEKESTLFYKEDNKDQKTINSKNNNTTNKEEKNIIYNQIKKEQSNEEKEMKTGIKRDTLKEEYSNECISKLKKLNLFNFTAVIVNIGSTKTTCTPIINGIPLPDLTHIYYIGGYDIDNQIFEEMKKKEKYQKNVSMDIARIAKEKNVFTPKNREECGYLSLLYNKNPQNYLINSFELSFNKIFESAVNSTEIFFSQYSLDNYLKTESYKNLHKYDLNFNFLFTQNTLPKVIYNTIQKCPIDYRKTLFHNIYITGGSSVIRGFRERLENELYELINNQNFYNKTVINVHSLKRKLLQKYSIYTGSHYFLEVFNYYNYNVTKQDYEEYGENILAKFSLQGKLLY